MNKAIAILNTLWYGWLLISISATAVIMAGLAPALFFEGRYAVGAVLGTTAGVLLAALGRAGWETVQEWRRDRAMKKAGWARG